MADRILVIISRESLSTPIRHPLGVEKFSEIFLLRICWCVGACHRDLASVAICRTFFRPWRKRWHAVRVLVKIISKQRVLRGWTGTKHGEHGVENEELQFVERR
jgi:hypothetical protein